jgi:hypothetical protein
MENNKSPKAAAQDINNKLIEVKEATVDDKDIQNEAKRALQATGQIIKKLVPGFEYTGSVALHFYFSELQGPSFTTQVHLGDTRQYTVALAYNRLLEKLRTSFGHKPLAKRK